MPARKTHFQPHWKSRELDGIPVGEWLDAGNSPFCARCLLCCDSFSISNSGFAQLKGHHLGKKHQEIFKARFLICDQLKLSTSKLGTLAQNDKHDGNTGTSALSHDLQVTRAEAIWALEIAKSNFSFKSCSETTDLFTYMFPDSKIAADMKFKEKKAAYVLRHGLAPHFTSGLKKELRNTSHISILFDETTTSQVKCQMDFHVQYWSEIKNKVCVRYMTSVFLGHSTAEVVVEKLLSVLDDFGLPLSKLLALSMDGPNVNKAILKKIQTLLEETSEKRLVDATFCNLHLVHNTFRAFLIQLSKVFNFEELATDLHSFFKLSAARREDYAGMSELTDTLAQFMLRLVSSRWLTAGPVAERILNQFRNLQAYFIEYLPKQKNFQKQIGSSARYQRIREKMVQKTTKAYLCFIVYLFQPFEMFLTTFQDEGPLIHKLYSQLNALFKSIMSVFIKDEPCQSKEGKDLLATDIQNAENWKPLTEMEIGTSTARELQPLAVDLRKKFRLSVRSALLHTAKYLGDRIPLENRLLQDVQILNPNRDVTGNLNRDLRSIDRLCKAVHMHDNDVDIIRKQWIVYVLRSKECRDPQSKCRVDTFWHTVCEMRDQDGTLMHDKMFMLIKAILCIPHANAEPERGFSINNSILSKERQSLSPETIISLRTVKSTISNQYDGKVMDVPISMELLKAVRESHSRYQKEMQDAEKARREEQRKKDEKAKSMIAAQEIVKRKADLELDLNKWNTDIRKLRAEKEITSEMLKEGQMRLENGICRKNFKEISLARNIIIAANKKTEELDDELKKLDSMKENIIMKRFKLA